MLHLYKKYLHKYIFMLLLSALSIRCMYNSRDLFSSILQTIKMTKLLDSVVFLVVMCVTVRGTLCCPAKLPVVTTSDTVQKCVTDEVLNTCFTAKKAGGEVSVQ